MSKHIPIYKKEEIKSNLFSFYEKALATWPVPYEEFMVATHYGDTHVIASGPKQAAAGHEEKEEEEEATAVPPPSTSPLVLIHAAGINATMWSPNMTAFSNSYRVYALDTIGDLGKSVLKDADYYPKTPQDYTRWLTDVFDSLGIRQAHVIGSSMGGWITHSASIFAPERIKKAVLIDPAAGIPTRTKWAKLFLLAAIFPFKSNYKRIAHKILGNRKDEEGNANKLWFDYLVTVFASRVKPRLGMPSKFSDLQLTNTKVPMLLLIGQEEMLYGSIDATVERARRLIPRIQIEIIPKAGHLPNVDQPDMVNAMILKFLAQ